VKVTASNMALASKEYISMEKDVNVFLNYHISNRCYLLFSSSQSEQLPLKISNHCRRYYDLYYHQRGNSFRKATVS